MRLRSYQNDIFNQLVSSTLNDLVQLDTGAGKTPVEAAIARHYDNVILLAHRNILITQMSEKLAAFGIYHDTISTEHTRRRCMYVHMLHGHGNYIQRHNKKKLVVSIDSLIARYEKGLIDIDFSLGWVIQIDEAHHVLPTNKWGRLREIFPNARFIGYTGTPARYDGGSLCVSSGGLFDKLVQAEELKDNSTTKLIEMGFLSDFEVFSPVCAHELNAYSEKELALAADPVDYYKEHMRGLRTVMFCPSILNAEEFAEQFRSAGIRAACISSSKSAVEIAYIIDAFTSKQIDVLTNVDMVSEGFDVPSIDALIFAKRTGSFVMYRQWCGRVLRKCEGKERAVIVDLVDNVERHGYPDDAVVWDIENPPKGLGRLRKIPCEKCGCWFNISEPTCPSCGCVNSLLTGKTIGSFYVRLKKYIDWSFVHKQRDIYYKAKHNIREYKEKTSEALMKEHFSDSWGKSSVDTLIYKLRQWSIDTIENNGIGIEDIRDYVSSDAFKNKMFWIDNFTVKDMNDNNTKKVIKVYKQWQKSH